MSGLSEIQEKLAAARKEITLLKQSVEKSRSFKYNGGIHDIYSDSYMGPPFPQLNQIRLRRVLRGHFGKVYSADWAGDSVNLVSVSQDGKLILWNGITTNKFQSIPLASSWIIACAYEQITSQLIACGGLDNICSIYKVVPGARIVKPSAELAGHQGYISSFQFIDTKRILTGSGDSTCNCWDIDKSKPISRFTEHTADVMSISLNRQDENIFASGSCDGTAKIWDIRLGKSVSTFHGHESDVNSVAFFPDGLSIATGSDDSTCRIFDLRSVNEIGTFGMDKLISGITSVSFSHSGRFLFAGYEDYNCRCWDILQPKNVPPAAILGGHENRVSVVSVNRSGDAILTASWDTFIKIWS